MMKRNRWMLIALALPWLYLPLRAAEAPVPGPQADVALPTEAESPADAQAAPPAEADAPAASEEAAPAPAPPRTAQPREQLSLDNNLSFPVDI